MSVVKSIVYIFIVTVVFFLVSFAPVRAFSVNPSRLSVVYDPGTTAKIEIKVHNNNSTPVAYAVGVTGVTQDDAGRPHFLQNSDQAEAWLQLPSKPIIVSSNTTVSVPVTIEVPRDAISGSAHYLAITVEPVGGNNASVSLREQLAILLSLQISGMVHESVSITAWHLSRAVITSSNWPFTVEFKNFGTIAVPLAGTVSVHQGATQIFNTAESLGNDLLAGSRRTITRTISLPSELVWPGRYTVTFQLTYGQTRQTSMATATVIYLPLWFLILFGILVIAGIIASLKYFSRRRPIGANL